MNELGYECQVKIENIHKCKVQDLWTHAILIALGLGYPIRILTLKNKSLINIPAMLWKFFDAKMTKH